MFENELGRSGKTVTGVITLDTALLAESPPDTIRSKTLRTLGGLAVLGLITGLVVSFSGVPYLRWDRPLVDGKDGADLQEADMAFTRYVTIGSSRQIHANEYGDGLPLVVFVPLSDLGAEDGVAEEF